MGQNKSDATTGGLIEGNPLTALPARYLNPSLGECLHGLMDRSRLPERQTEGSSPQNQVALSSFVDLPGNFELDGFFRYVDSLPSQGVPRYFNLDIRLGWHATKNVELSLVGQDLLYPHHPEWSGGTQIKRGV